MKRRRLRTPLGYSYLFSLSEQSPLFANQGKWEESHPEGRRRLAGRWARDAVLL